MSCGSAGAGSSTTRSFTQPLRDEIRECAERVVAKASLEIEFVRKKDFRKEERVKEIVAERGDHPGLVHIFSAMEPCGLLPAVARQAPPDVSQGQVGEVYPLLLLLHRRGAGALLPGVPTWAPFRLQFYFSGHNWLARKLTEQGIAHTLVENAFLEICNFERAQELADSLHPEARSAGLQANVALAMPSRTDNCCG